MMELMASFVSDSSTTASATGSALGLVAALASTTFVVDLFLLLLFFFFLFLALFEGDTSEDLADFAKHGQQNVHAFFISSPVGASPRRW
jgi:hypothetical protein